MSNVPSPPVAVPSTPTLKLCPYPGCEHDAVPAQAPACPRCGRRVKRCSECQALNRRFSRFCQGCSHGLAEQAGQWSQYQGGPYRQGLIGQRLDIPFAELELKSALNHRFKGPCRSLLFYEGLLLATSADGETAAFEVPTGKIFREWRSASEVVHSGACASGFLWLPGAQQVTVTPLASLEADSDPNVIYSDKLPGQIVHPPLAFGASLFLVLADSAGRSMLVTLRAEATSKGVRLSPPEVLHRGQTLSAPILSSAEPGTVLFLDEVPSGLRLYRVRRENGGFSTLPQPIVDAPAGLLTEISPASIGNLLYAVFKERRRLCRIDLKSSRWDGELASDVRSFALAGKQDGVVLQSAGMQLLSRKNEETVLDPMAGPPLIWRDLAVVLGLGNGRVRLHSWENLPRETDVRVSQDPYAAVSALAAFEDFLAAGTEDGMLTVFRLQRSERA